jgi:hypothetical protein
MWPQVVSASTQELPSTLGAPLQCWGGPAKAARLHLSPYGRPSFNMAAVGRMPAATGAVRGCSDGSCPENFRTTSTSSSSTIVSNPGPSFTASEGAQPPLGLELSDPLSLPPREHVLTWALSYPHRSLDHRQHRHRPLRLDGRRSWACHSRCCRRHGPLRGPQRRRERGALGWCELTCAVHVHAPDHLRYLTNLSQ